MLALAGDADPDVASLAGKVAASLVSSLAQDRPALALSQFTPALLFPEDADARLRAFTALTALIDELDKHKGPGGDLLTVTVLPQESKLLVAAYLCFGRANRVERAQKSAFDSAGFFSYVVV